jgi:hypothetical protein
MLGGHLVVEELYAAEIPSENEAATSAAAWAGPIMMCGREQRVPGGETDSLRLRGRARRRRGDVAGSRGANMGVATTADPDVLAIRCSSRVGVLVVQPTEHGFAPHGSRQYSLGWRQPSRSQRRLLA